MNCIKTEYFFRKGEEGTQKLTHLNVVLGSTIIYASDHCGTVYIFFYQQQRQACFTTALGCTLLVLRGAKSNSHKIICSNK